MKLAAVPSNEETQGATRASIVFERLREDILEGRFAPGEKLRIEALEERYQVGASPIREALNRLATEGFLRFSPGKGFFCRELDPKEIYDLYQLRKALEIGGIKLAVQRARELKSARAEIEQLKMKLESRKHIERAKGILMRRTGLSEQEAYRILQRTSQDRSVPMVDVAKEVLASEPK